MQNKNLKIAVIGGGPGGLYFSILTKKAFPNYEIEIFERNRPDDSFGFGVVFSDETLGEFLKRDMKSYELIRSEFAYWDDIVVARDGQSVSIAGNGFCGCSRKTLLQLLHKRCAEEGVVLNFEAEIGGVEQFQNYDIVLASDGISSGIRTSMSDIFGTKIDLKANRFVWLGSTKPLDAFTYFFRTTPAGTIVAHSYQYQQQTPDGKSAISTWIFECSNDTFNKLGFEITNESDTIEKIAAIFKDELDGHALISNKSHWRQFPHVTNQKWFHNNIVLLGDAKATAHYSIGSGTKLAMDCAIGLFDALAEHQNDIQKVFETYEKNRRNPVEMIQYAALVSLDWFENMDRNIKHDFYQFALGCMTRSKKVTFENLKLRDKSFTDKVLTEFNAKQNLDPAIPAAFSGFRIKNLELQNRIVMSAMGQYSATDGLVNNWHLIHYSSRALGGVGLIITEMTAVAENGRITPKCAGIYTENQTNAWKNIVDFVHQNTATKIAIQLGHSGRKGAVYPPFDDKSIENPWELISASAIPFKETAQTPREMTLGDMDTVVDDFVKATKNADKAGFDMIELQAHHGFLLASFLSPLTNHRTDEFGGSIENRLRFPLRVFEAIRKNFDAEKPISVRISATDWAEGGITNQDVEAVVVAFQKAGADLINVSTGNTVANQQPKTGRMYQVPFSDSIRNILHIPTITAGSITDIDQINTIILNGKADLVALGKPLLTDPNFVRKAQAYENFIPNDFPKQYQSAVPQFVSTIQTERKQTETMRKALKPKSNKI